MFRFLQIFAVLLLFSGNFLSAQWVQTNGPGGGECASWVATGDSLIIAMETPDGFTLYRSTNKGDAWEETYSYKYKAYPSNFTVAGPLYYSGNTWYLANVGFGVVRSTDFGGSWENKSSGLPNGAIWSLGELDGILYAGTGYGVYRSANKGVTWSYYNKLLRQDILEFIQFGDVYFAGADAINPIENGGIYMSSDKGATWQHSTSGLPEESMFVQFCIHNANLFAVVVDEKTADRKNFVYRYDKANNSWKKILNGSTNWSGGLAPFGKTLAAVFDSVYFSDDNGDTWKVMGKSQYPWVYLYRGINSGASIYARRSEIGFIRSEDGGITWKELNNSMVNSSIFTVIANDASVFAVTNNGLAYRTKDNGQSWRSLNVGVENGTGIGCVYQTGKTIFVGTVGQMNAPYDTTYSMLYRSTDDGETWKGATIHSQSDSLIASYHIISTGNSLFVSGMRGIFRSENSGETWQKLPVGLKPDEEIFAIASRGSTVFAGSSNYSEGSVFRSDDNGNTWQNLGSKGFIAGTLVIQGNNVFARDFEGRGIFRSTDNGETWRAVNNGLDIGEMFGGITAAGNDLYVASNGKIFRSTNNGDEWKNIGMTNARVVAVNSTHLFAGTSLNGVWRRPLSDIVAVEEQGTVAANFGIIPNPFSAAAGITVQTDEPGRVRLGVSDLFGREIAVLCDELLTAGSHSFTWDGRNSAGDLLPGGVYFCRVQTPSGTEVREVVLVR